MGEAQDLHRGDLLKVRDGGSGTGGTCLLVSPLRLPWWLGIRDADSGEHTHKFGTHVHNV